MKGEFTEKKYFPSNIMTIIRQLRSIRKLPLQNKRDESTHQDELFFRSNQGWKQLSTTKYTLCFTKSRIKDFIDNLKNIQYILTIFSWE